MTYGILVDSWREKVTVYIGLPTGYSQSNPRPPGQNQKYTKQRSRCEKEISREEWRMDKEMRKIREDEDEGIQNAIYVLKYTYIKEQF